MSNYRGCNIKTLPDNGRHGLRSERFCQKPYDLWSRTPPETVRTSLPWKIQVLPARLNCCKNMNRKIMFSEQNRRLEGKTYNLRRVELGFGWRASNMALPKPSASLKRKMSFGATFIFVAASGLSETLSGIYFVVGILFLSSF